MDAYDYSSQGSDCGQEEPLTRRIRNLLKEYPDGLAVPKELLQNADDARATEACLLLDLTQHSRKHLINDKIADFQGPALLFWNNQTFTDADFANLREFGGETKLEDRQKVGKFGLGFNSVYNLTDLPMFVSRNALRVLDPHKKFFLGKKGIGYDLNLSEGNRKTWADILRGQLDPFIGIQGFQSSRGRIDYKGTLFRFPLRNKKHSDWSEISKRVYTKEDALSLIDMTAKSANLFLIFLQFVSKLDILFRDETEDTFRTIASVSRSFIGFDIAFSQVLLETKKKFHRNYQIAVQDDVKKKLRKWDIFVRAPGIKSTLDETPCVGAVAFPSIDLKLSSNTEAQLMFCFLPLPHPCSTGLPFLVNGTFAVTSSRRHLELETADDRSQQKSIEGRWNRDILVKAVVPSLFDALLSKSHTHSQEQLFNLFPVLNRDLDKVCSSVLEAFYHQLTTDADMRLFTSPYEAEDHFFSLHDENVVIISDSIPTVVHEHILACCSIDSDKVMLSLPSEINKTLHHLERAFYDRKVFSLIEIFSRLPFEKLTDCSPDIRLHYGKLINFILNSSIDKDMLSVLREKPWVLVDDDDDDSEIKCVKKPKELVSPHSKIRRLLFFTKAFFPSDEMEIDNNGLDIMCQQLKLNDRYLPVSAVTKIKDNLNAMRNTTQHKIRLKEYFDHIEQNQYHYRTTNEHDFFSDLLLPNSRNGHFGVEPDSVYQKELEDIIGYVRQVMDFKALGVSRANYVDECMGLFKTPSAKNVIRNWQSLVKDVEKDFDEKCRKVLYILLFLSSSTESTVEECKIAVRDKALLPSDDRHFCVASQLCLNNRAPIFTDHFHRVNSLITSDKRIRSFLEQCGVAKNFKAATYVEMINSLKTARNQEQLRNIRDILELIQKNKLTVAQLPDTELQFVPIGELCLNDYNLNNALSESQLVFCHPDIPHCLATYFGVKTKRSMIECLNSDSTFEPFAQREDLCGRLKRIAESYSNPIDVFKELIQNADDAGATTILFVLDQRTAPMSPKVVNKGYEKLLEPALLVFNDSYFTTKDVNGLQKLGMGSKVNDPEKIGKFGVGFNCVYGLSDYPCFLTQVDAAGGGNFFLLDPTCVISGSGGQRINITPGFVQNFPNTFGCFLREKPELNALEGKTMFRFPLRRQRSELGDKVLEPKDMLESLQLFSSGLQECLLFLRNVKVIKVAQIDVRGTWRQIRTVFKTVTEMSTPSYDVTQSVTTQAKLSYVALKESERKVLSRWLVSYHDGSTSTTLSSSERNPNTSASVACQLKDTSVDCTKNSMAPGIWCYLPLEEVSAQMRNSSDPALPVAVNASFMLDESRKMLSLASNEKRGAWNVYLLKSSVGAAYAGLIMHSVAAWRNSPKMYSIQSFLKHFPYSDHGMQKLKNSVNSIIAQGLLSNLKAQKWVPQLGADKSLKTFKRNDEVRNFTSCYPWPQSPHFPAVFKISEALGFNITQIPRNYAKLLSTFDCRIKWLEPLELLNSLLTLQFQKSRIERSVFGSLQNLTCLLDWSRDELQNYADIDKLPIFLTANGYLQKNSENRLYSSAFEIAQIFPSLKDRILHSEVNSRLPPLAVNLTVAEFFDLLNENFPDLCGENVVNVAQRKRSETLRWVELIWNFIEYHKDEIKTIFLDQFTKLSILMTQDRTKQMYLHPISAGDERVFAALPKVKIGPVAISLQNYKCFFELVPEMSSNCRSLLAPYILPHELRLNQQINVLYIISTEENRAEELDAIIRVMLYRYFRDLYTDDSDQFDDVDFVRLKSIPIFPTVTEEIESLSDVLTVYSIPNNVPKIGFSLVTVQAEKYVVQESCGKGAEFQQRLGIVFKTVTQIYTEAIILKHFQKFNFPAVDKHLEFLARYLEIESGDCNNRESGQILLPSLKSCCFLETGSNEEKVKPSDLFDFKNFLYRTFRTGKLIDRKYEAHLPLLRLCGLNHKITKPEYEGMLADHTANIYGDTYQDSGQIFRVFGALMAEFRRLNLGVDDFKKVGSLAMFETLNSEFHKLDDVYLYHQRTLVEHVANILTEDYSEKLSEQPTGRQSLITFWARGLLNTAIEPSPALVLKNLEKLLQVQESDNEIWHCVDYIARQRSDQTTLNRLSKLPCIPASSRKNGRLAPRNICKTFQCNLACEKVCKLRLYIDEPSNKFLSLWNCLSQLGASNLPTLQQIVYAIEEFHKEVSKNQIWENNPNIKKKFRDLEKHFWFCSNDVEFSQLSADCPVYLLSEDCILRDIHELVIIDNVRLYKNICSGGNNSLQKERDERLESMSATFPFADSEVFRACRQQYELLKHLPNRIRPKFFTEICQVTLDPSTNSVSNSTVDQFDLEQFTLQTNRPDFRKKLASVIDAQDWLAYFSSRFYAVTKPELSEIIQTVEKCLKSAKLKPVKTVTFMYTVERGSRRVRNTFEEDFHYDRDQHTIFFTYPFRNRGPKGEKAMLDCLTGCLFQSSEMKLDSKVVKILSDLIFVCKSVNDENMLLNKYGIETKLELDSMDILIGNVVPRLCYAIIDRDLSKRFEINDLVAVTYGNNLGVEQEQVYFYAKFLGIVRESSNATPQIKLEVKYNITKLMPKDKVFGFLEKSTITGSNASDENPSERTEEQFQKDVEKLNQIIWTAALARKGSLNLSSDLKDLERRIVSSIVQKYLDPERQNRLVNLVGQSIRTQIEAERDHDKSQSRSSEVGVEFDTVPQAAEEFLKFHFERMQEEIETHRKQMQVAGKKSRKRKSRNRLCSGSDHEQQSVVDFHLDAIQDAQPHPVLARLWLRQAKEHLSSLETFESDTTKHSSSLDWKVHITSKVLESSLMALICLKDGNRATAQWSNEEKRDLNNLVETLKSLSPELTDIINHTLQVLEKVPRSCWNHKPDQAQSLTAGNQVDVNFTRMFRACVKTVFDKAVSQVPQR